MPGLYESMWDRSIQWTGGNHIITGHEMDLWKLLFPFGIPKTIVVDADVFGRGVQENFPADITRHGTCSYKG